jgi:ribosomal protein S18 acetylase RimI-like enzyme
MVRTSNLEVIEFYDRLGYQKDEVVVFSKRLITDPE